MGVNTVPDLPELFGLRLRTSRLELRLPLLPELAQLRELAHAGIHPPEEMPFAVPWTDEPYSEEFVVAYHQQQLEIWSPAAWNLHLGVWVEGQLIGSQTLHGTDFVKTRAVHTGSWLGREFQ